MTREQKIYMLELIKLAESDNRFMAKLLDTIGTYGMKHIGEVREQLATDTDKMEL